MSKFYPYTMVADTAGMLHLKMEPLRVIRLLIILRLLPLLVLWLIIFAIGIVPGWVYMILAFALFSFSALFFSEPIVFEVAVLPAEIIIKRTAWRIYRTEKYGVKQAKHIGYYTVKGFMGKRAAYYNLKMEKGANWRLLSVLPGDVEEMNARLEQITGLKCISK